MGEIDYQSINKTLENLPRAAIQMVPDDPLLPYLVTLSPPSATKENIKTVLIVMSLLSRRLAVVFNQLAQEQEKLIQEWRD